MKPVSFCQPRVRRASPSAAARITVAAGARKFTASPRPRDGTVTVVNRLVPDPERPRQLHKTDGGYGSASRCAAQAATINEGVAYTSARAPDHHDDRIAEAGKEGTSDNPNRGGGQRTRGTRSAGCRAQVMAGRGRMDGFIRRVPGTRAIVVGYLFLTVYIEERTIGFNVLKL